MEWTEMARSKCCVGTSSEKRLGCATTNQDKVCVPITYGVGQGRLGCLAWRSTLPRRGSGRAWKLGKTGKNLGGTVRQNGERQQIDRGEWRMMGKKELRAVCGRALAGQRKEDGSAEERGGD